MKDILSAFAEHGLDPGDLILNGKFHRFPVDAKDSKKSGYYVGYQNHTRSSGELFHVVVFGNFRDPNSPWKFQSDVNFTADDRQTMKEQIKKAKKQEDEARERMWEETTCEVERKWESLSSYGVAPYLQRKQIEKCPDLGIRFESGGGFYVPMQDEKGKMWSLQRYQSDGGRFFYPGARTRGCFHVLGDIQAAGGETLYLAEGLATAASIRIATGATVVCGFNSGNLEAVSRYLRANFNRANIVVCGDDDRWPNKAGEIKNIGREKAELAARAVGGVAIFPKFANPDPEQRPTDFNDLHVKEGVEKVRDQILGIKKPLAQFVMALGFKDNEYFFTSTSNRQIVSISKFNEEAFLGLLPIEYWESVFPAGGSARADWTTARSRMMDEARKLGIFQHSKVRGAGVWEDEGRSVVNMGDHLVLNGTRLDFGELKSRYFYTLGVKLPDLQTVPLGTSECDDLLRVCSLFRWRKPHFGMLLAGGLVTARICGALPVRPHIWLTGGAQTGKTTVMERLIYPIIGEPVIMAAGRSSEAGIRQSLKYDAIPVLFDEFESNGPRSSDGIQAVLDLMRVSWSNGKSNILKGSSGGAATSFQARFSAIVSSIRQSFINDADRQRFATIELMPHDSDEKHWHELDGLLSKIDSKYADRLFLRTIDKIPVLLANYRTLKSVLARRVSQRYGDQYGMLLAGYSILLQDEPLTEAAAENLAEKLDLQDGLQASKEVDHHACVDHLLTKKIIAEINGQKEERSISEMIDLIRSGSEKYSLSLKRIGLLVEDGYLWIANDHGELKSLYARTRWENSLKVSLDRLPGATRQNNKKSLFGKDMRFVKIPLSTVFKEPSDSTSDTEREGK